ncbi:hypothetical protein NESM_000273100 [Novymonas esmeraldas]|uniref:Uncharacterized protein n=1 Tax=Novymonas esmeraldas TaxID=1808958 RepID=A0AAW0F629_9TRYP
MQRTPRYRSLKVSIARLTAGMREGLWTTRTWKQMESLWTRFHTYAAQRGLPMSDQTGTLFAHDLDVAPTAKVGYANSLANLFLKMGFAAPENAGHLNVVSGPSAHNAGSQGLANRMRGSDCELFVTAEAKRAGVASKTLAESLAYTQASSEPHPLLNNSTPTLIAILLMMRCGGVEPNPGPVVRCLRWNYEG